MVLIYHSCKGFSDLEELWDDLLVSRLKYNALGDFQDNLPGSLLTESSHMSPFHNRFERFVACFNQMVLIFPLDMYFVCSINVDLYNLPLIFSVFKFFKSGADFGRFMGSLLGNLLKYNALEDLSEILWKTSRKSYGRLLGSLLAHYILEDLREDFP
ncbi:hypothetical protein IGI04_002993 [Brassica rapa subsp. trilocularis]|uniref:Uncharacterized protein n=1 Tax=Brassica rapa subsp. trilocularis TaxID=1813537 RepID=A0ABQ7NX33_BRACM|nr:hypothetical protein IGI04_002993 [Brassica rapa subsp. trilocularis]